MLTGLFLKFLATGLGKKLPAWLWEIVIIALLALLLALGHHVAVVHHDNGVRAEQKAKDQKIIDGLNAQLRAISTAKNTQQVVTRTNIQTVTKVIHDKELEAQKVESAPLPGKCQSPKAVLGADL